MRKPPESQPAVPPQEELSELAGRLSGTIVTLRTDLDVSRHVTHAGPQYVLRDPVSFDSFAIGVQEYQILLNINDERTLGEVFDRLVSQGFAEPEDGEAFYGYVLELHRAGLLSLPISDASALFERFERRRMAERKSLAMGFLFFRAPLFNPDAFLTRTARYVRWLFEKPGLILWAVLMLIAGVVAVGRWQDLTAPVLSMIQGANLPLLWLLLIGLKVVHEFGHAYACKLRGGHVPEMGAFFIVFTPCAYVDASDSWRFSRMRDRLAVSLGGVYVESMVGAVALLAWAASGPGVFNTLCYQTFLLSTVVTLGFNLNPLMKFDGYYVLSDLMRMPNLRQRSSDAVGAGFDAIALGMKARWRAMGGQSIRRWLVIFGVASAIYKVTLVISICALIATKFYLVGLLLAAFYVATSVGGGVWKLGRHLLISPETQPVRRRAVCVAATLALVLIVGLGVLPVRPPVSAMGVVSAERVEPVTTSSGGFLIEAPLARAGAVDAGVVLARLENPALSGDLAEAVARRLSANRRLASTLSSGTAASVPAVFELRVAAKAEAEAARKADGLEVASSASGWFAPADSLPIGAYLQPETPLGTLHSGDQMIRLFLDDAALREAELGVGTEVSLRVQHRPQSPVTGRVVAVVEEARRENIPPTLTQPGGGELTVDGQGRTAVALHEVVVKLGENDGDKQALPIGTTVRLNVPGPPRTVIGHVYERVAAFMLKLRLS